MATKLPLERLAEFLLNFISGGTFVETLNNNYKIW
jgi:hypothetical protein